MKKLKVIWGEVKAGLTIIAIIVGILYSISSVVHRLQYGYWLAEDEIHVVQVVRKAEYNDKYLVYREFEFDLFETKEQREKRYKEMTRPRPYVMETVYKGIVTKDLGDKEYLKNLKCKRYDDAIKVYEDKKKERIALKLANEREEAKEDADFEAIQSTDCN